MRTRTAIALASAALTLAACGSDDASSPAPAPPAGSGTTGAASYDGPTIPPGTYTKTFTRADLRRLDIAVGDLDPGQLGPDGKGVVLYKFGESDWTEWSGPDAAAADVGSSGTHTYDDDGNLVFTEPCCGETVLTWSIDSGALTLTAIGPDVALADPMVHLMRDGVYEKTE